MRCVPPPSLCNVNKTESLAKQLCVGLSSLAVVLELLTGSGNKTRWMNLAHGTECSRWRRNQDNLLCLFLLFYGIPSMCAVSRSHKDDHPLPVDRSRMLALVSLEHLGVSHCCITCSGIVDNKLADISMIVAGRM